MMLALGFSSGLPFLLVGNTLGYWLRDEGTTLAAIGFLSWVGIAYSLKVLLGADPGSRECAVFGCWAGGAAGWPLSQIHRRRWPCSPWRCWGPAHGLLVLGAFALVVAFAAATQDIAIDAWRIEIASRSR